MTVVLQRNPSLIAPTSASRIDLIYRLEHISLLDFKLLLTPTTVSGQEEAEIHPP